MEYFLLKPNYVTLSRYISFGMTQEQFEMNYADGYPLMIDAYYDSNDHLKFSGDHIQEVEEGFKAITERFGLTEHHENLFFLALSKRYEMDQVAFVLQDEYLAQKRAQELAKLILAFKVTPQDKLYALQLKTNDTETSPNIKDNALTSWIGKLLLDAIERNQEPIGLFGLTGDKFLRGSVEQLREIASRKIPNPSTGRNKYLADFCLYLYPYLINETDIRPDVSTLFSDNQLKFYFELLALLDMLNPSRIDSYPEDYMRTILKYRIKTLNT